FRSPLADAMLARTDFDDAQVITGRTLTGLIKNAQAQIEARNADSRKNVLKYDDVLNRQRLAIYSDRRVILEGDNIAERVQHFMEDAITQVIRDHTAKGHDESWDFDALWTELKSLYPMDVTVEEVAADARTRKGGIDQEGLIREILSDAKIAYDKREESLGGEAMRELERRVVLQVLDRRWRDHLYEMDYLKDGIGLRSMAQRDPLIEYQREGHLMYETMMNQIKEETVGYMFNLEVQVNEQAGGSVEAKGLAGAPEANQQKLAYSAPDEDGDAEVHDADGNVAGGSARPNTTSGTPQNREERRKQAKRNR
ncbi:MAG: preprotein translocase subunit SecA, partial [Microbacterium gubbeenense]